METVVARRRLFGPLTRWCAIGSVVASLLAWAGWEVVDRFPGWHEWWQLRAAAAELRAPQAAMADQASVTLGRAGAAGVSWLIRAAADRDPNVRYRAFRGIGYRGASVRAIPTLIAGLDDPDRRIRWLAVTTLGQIGPDAVASTDRLIRLLDDPDPDRRVQVALALRQINLATEPTWRPMLVAILTDPDLTRYPARAYLAAIIHDQVPRASAEAVAGLLRLLVADNPTSRRQAAESLGQFGLEARSAVPALTAALRDPDWVVRCRAVASLHAIEGEGSDRARVVLQDLANRGLVPAALRQPVAGLLSTAPLEAEYPSDCDRMVSFVASQIEANEESAGRSPPSIGQQP